MCVSMSLVAWREVYVCMYVCMSTTVPPARSSRRASGKVGLYYGMSMAGEA